MDQLCSPLFLRTKPTTHDLFHYYLVCSVDGCESNHGYQVLGYQVYLDQQLHVSVPGALASQVELTGMKDGCEYLLQVR